MIDILLAAFNGEEYISQQIDSIINQTYSDWKLYISDDCSTDSTLEIVKSYIEKHPSKIFLIENTKSSGSAMNHFFRLLQHAKSNYIMFCDQDDVWLPDKIILTLEKMKESENNYDKDKPILIYTDLIVADEKLNVISNSMFKYQSLRINNNKLNALLAQNNVTGCTVMINKKLLEIVKNNIPKSSIMHDWWLALVAATFGDVVFIDKPTVLYRQHSNNQVGAKNTRNIFYIINCINGKKIKKDINNTYIQARCLLDIYNNEISLEKIKIISAYVEIPMLCKINKIMYLYKYGFLKKSIVRKIGQIIYI